jgi:ribosomal protein L37AE/L43A
MTAEAASITSTELNRQKTFPCNACGAKLAFKPGSETLTCPYCGSTNAIAESTGTVEELDFDEYLTALEAQSETVTQQAVKCSNCGAEQTLPPAISIGECTFCHSPLASTSYAQRLIKPKAVAPFAVDKNRAQEIFRSWIGSLWLAPGKLKKYAQSDAGLRGIYIPYWTYDCLTDTDYAGMRGDYYYETETVWVKNANGEDVQQQRQVQKIRWTPAQGHVDCTHDDVLVLASQSFPRELNAPLSGWQLGGLKPYQAEYLAGFQVEGYRLGLKDGFASAKPVIDTTITQAIRRDIGGDQQRIEQTRVQYHDVTFKHVLLPLWMNSYTFKGKTYRFMINGQTGEVKGEWPKSGWKILFIVMAVLIVLGIVLSLGGK